MAARALPSAGAATDNAKKPNGGKRYRGRSTTGPSKIDTTRSAGTKTSSATESWLPVPRNPRVLPIVEELKVFGRQRDNGWHGRFVDHASGEHHVGMADAAAKRPAARDHDAAVDRPPLTARRPHARGQAATVAEQLVAARRRQVRDEQGAGHLPIATHQPVDGRRAPVPRPRAAPPAVAVPTRRPPPARRRAIARCREAAPPVRREGGGRSRSRPTASRLRLRSADWSPRCRRSQWSWFIDVTTVGSAIEPVS